MKLIDKFIMNPIEKIVYWFFNGYHPKEKEVIKFKTYTMIIQPR